MRLEGGFALAGAPSTRGAFNHGTWVDVCTPDWRPILGGYVLSIAGYSGLRQQASLPATNAWDLGAIWPPRNVLENLNKHNLRGLVGTYARKSQQMCPMPLHQGNNLDQVWIPSDTALQLGMPIPTLAANVNVEKQLWPHSCDRCGKPAYVGFNQITCSVGCCSERR